MGKRWVVPLSELTATQRESLENWISWILAVVSPLVKYEKFNLKFNALLEINNLKINCLCKVYKWWTAAKEEPNILGCILNTLNLWPFLSAVTNIRPDWSKFKATIASQCAEKWATISGPGGVFSFNTLF